MPKLTIAVPCYNKERFIEQTLKSAFNQTDKDFELIVIDNCSTDRSWNIIQRLHKSHTSMQIFRNDYNLGMCGNWNKCIEKASGDYVFLLHGDDELSPYFVSTVKALINKYNPDTLDFSYAINTKRSLKKDGKIKDQLVNFVPKEKIFRQYLSEEIEIVIYTFVAKKNILIKHPYNLDYGFVADTECLRRIFSEDKNNILLYKEKMLCRKVYAYMSGLSMGDDEKYNLYRKETAMMNKQLLEKYDKPSIHKEVMHAYYAQELMDIGAMIYHKLYSEAKQQLKLKEKKILKYTGKKNIIRYYKLMIMTRNANIIPMRLKHIISSNRNLLNRLLTRK